MSADDLNSLISDTHQLKTMSSISLRNKALLLLILLFAKCMISP